MASTQCVRAGRDVRLGEIQQLVRHLDRLSRNARLYDRDHPTLKGMHEQLCRRWEAATREGALELELDADRVLWEEALVHEALERTGLLEESSPAA